MGIELKPNERPATMALWDAVCETDPKYTKQFNRGGGFKGTATNAVYLARKATEQFGPMGIGWGLELVREEYVPGHDIIVGGERVGQCMIHVALVRVWYVLNGERGEVLQYGQTTFVGINKNGIFTDEEAPKKSLTDGMTKALSLLGFAADIHLGLYDDNKYVNDLAAKFGADTAPQEKPAQKPAQRPTEASEVAAQIADLAQARWHEEWVVRLSEFCSGGGFPARVAEMDLGQRKTVLRSLQDMARGE